jgi:hypothetical protein
MTHGIKSQAFAAGLITTAATGCVAAGPGDTYQSDLQAYHACAAAVYNAPEYAALRATRHQTSITRRWSRWRATIWRPTKKFAYYRLRMRACSPAGRRFSTP